MEYRGDEGRQGKRGGQEEGRGTRREEGGEVETVEASQHPRAPMSVSIRGGLRQRGSEGGEDSEEREQGRGVKRRGREERGGNGGAKLVMKAQDKRGRRGGRGCDARGADGRVREGGGGGEERRGEERRGEEDGGGSSVLVRTHGQKSG
eukprot:3147592-Rhodomonas_salina.1